MRDQAAVSWRGVNETEGLFYINKNILKSLRFYEQSSRRATARHPPLHKEGFGLYCLSAPSDEGAVTASAVTEGEIVKTRYPFSLPPARTCSPPPSSEGGKGFYVFANRNGYELFPTGLCILLRNDTQVIPYGIIRLLLSLSNQSLPNIPLTKPEAEGES